MIQKEHILGVLVGIIAITGVQIATQMQMQRIAQQVQMVQDNLSASVIESDSIKIVENIPVIKNTCFNANFSATLGTDTSVAIGKQLTIIPVCDDFNLNTFFVGFSSLDKNALNGIDLKNNTTGKTYQVVLEDIGSYMSEDGKTHYAVGGEVKIDSMLSKNVSQNFSFVAKNEVQPYVLGFEINNSGVINNIPFSIYGNGSGIDNPPPLYWGWWCRNIRGGTGSVYMDQDHHGQRYCRTSQSSL